MIDGARIGVIGGTGMEALLEGGRLLSVETPFGNVAATVGTLGDAPAVVILRHGPGHALLPHEINYRAIIWAMRSSGVRQVFATAAVGSLAPELRTGDLALLSDFIDLTRGRTQSF